MFAEGDFAIQFRVRKCLDLQEFSWPDQNDLCFSARYLALFIMSLFTMGVNNTFSLSLCVGAQVRS